MGDRTATGRGAAVSALSPWAANLQEAQDAKQTTEVDKAFLKIIHFIALHPEDCKKWMDEHVVHIDTPFGKIWTVIHPTMKHGEMLIIPRP